MGCAETRGGTAETGVSEMDAMNKKPAENGLFGASASPEPAPRGPGRPKGSLNRRSRDWQAYVAAAGRRHPLEFLLDVVTATPEQLRERYGAVDLLDEAGERRLVSSFGPKDVLAAQIRAAEVALPYLEQKLPTAVEDVSEGRRMIVVVGQLSGEQQSEAQQRLGWALRGEQNQGVIDAVLEKSDGDQSDGFVKRRKNNEE